MIMTITIKECFLTCVQAVLAMTGGVMSDPSEFQSVLVEQIADQSRILKVPSTQL